jgi:hypothetical protein
MRKATFSSHRATIVNAESTHVCKARVHIDLMALQEVGWVGSIDSVPQ